MPYDRADDPVDQLYRISEELKDMSMCTCYQNLFPFCLLRSP